MIHTHLYTYAVTYMNIKYIRTGAERERGGERGGVSGPGEYVFIMIICLVYF